MMQFAPTLRRRETRPAAPPSPRSSLATGGALVATSLLFALGFGHRAGRTQLLERWPQFAGRVGHLPPWVALPSALGTASLITALLGMYWDISLHIDNGRDAGPLANPAHYLILVGLFGIFAAGFLADVHPAREARARPRSASTTAGMRRSAAC